MIATDHVSGTCVSGNGLPHRLAALYATLDPPEQNNLRLLLGMAAGDLDQAGVTPSPAGHRSALRVTTDTLVAIQPTGRQNVDRGILWHGRPTWMSDALLADLQDEAAAQRSSAKLYERQYLGRGGSVAESLAVSDHLRLTVSEAAGSVTPTGVASYLYYEREGMGISPHIDTEVFALNALILLRHDARGAPRSHFVVMPPGADSYEQIPLTPGDMLVLYADSVVHGREPVGPHELVQVLTMGFSAASDRTPFSL